LCHSPRKKSILAPKCRTWVNEHVEVIAQNRVSEDPDPTVIGDLPKLFAKHLAADLVDDPLPIHNPRHAMVNSNLHLMLCFDAGEPHLATKIDLQFAVEYFRPVPYF